MVCLAHKIPDRSRAKYIRIAGNGPNALDFHIAFYIGHLAATEPAARFHIVSKDTGFDPLIQHLKGKKILAMRAKSIDDIVPSKVSATKGLPERVAAVVANLKQRGASKPRTAKTLSTTIASLFQKKLSDSEIADLVAELDRVGYVVVRDGKVAYNLA